MGEPYSTRLRVRLARLCGTVRTALFGVVIIQPRTTSTSSSSRCPHAPPREGRRGGALSGVEPPCTRAEPVAIRRSAQTTGRPALPDRVGRGARVCSRRRIRRGPAGRGTGRLRSNRPPGPGGQRPCQGRSSCRRARKVPGVAASRRPGCSVRSSGGSRACVGSALNWLR